jgi:hypothetical protein
MQPFPLFPIAVIACGVFQGQIEKYLPEESRERINFLDYGLHSTPKKLKEAVQESIDRLEQPSLVVLGYGLCGNGLDGIQARDHVLLIARADDCIAILLGSYAAYRREFDAHPGTYYLTKGWLESGSNPLSEYQEYVERYGESSAEWIMDQQYQHYKRLVLVARTPEELERFRPQALDVARYCERWGMRYEELPGNDDYIRELVGIAMRLEESNPDFIVVPPGGTLKQREFIRTE